MRDLEYGRALRIRSRGQHAAADRQLLYASASTRVRRELGSRAARAQLHARMHYSAW